MREEEIDWNIYHIIQYEKTISPGDIEARTGFEQEIVRDSLKRMEKSCLIGFEGDNVRLLSLQEMLLKCSIKNTAAKPDSPVIIENGVIRANPNYKG